MGPNSYQPVIWYSHGPPVQICWPQLNDAHVSSSYPLPSSVCSLASCALPYFSPRETGKGYIKTEDYLGLLCFLNVTAETLTVPDPCHFYTSVSSLTETPQSPEHIEGGWLLSCHRAGLPPAFQQFPLWILLGRKLYLSVCKNMEQITLKLNFNFILFSNACSTTNHPDCIKNKTIQPENLKCQKYIFFSSPLYP